MEPSRKMFEMGVLMVEGSKMPALIAFKDENGKLVVTQTTIGDENEKSELFVELLKFLYKAYIFAGGDVAAMKEALLGFINDYPAEVKQ